MGAAYCPGCKPIANIDERAYDAHRRRTEPWRKWYNWAIWNGPHGLRMKCLMRDPICKVCKRVASEIADHIVPHKGNWKLFVDLLNLQGLCKKCHDEKTARENHE